MGAMRDKGWCSVITRLARCFSVVVIALATLLVTGCGSTAMDVGEGGYPPDFTLVVTVEAEEPEQAEGDPHRVPAQHVLASDRVLRVALGAGTRHEFYPGPTATLEPARVAALYRIVERHGLIDELGVDEAQLEAAAVVYHVTLSMRGQRRTYRTTPEASPGTLALVEALVALRGGR